MVDLDRARGDLGAFAAVAGYPLTVWQADSLQLEARITVIVAPRQSGKSRSLAVLALHRAFRAPGFRVLVVSAGEEASRRLLAEVRRIAAGSPLLRGSVVDETAGLVTLSNGSEVRSVPASERQIRGWSTDLLLIDEAAIVPDDLILGAALPTTAARPDARVVMASSATTASGAFYDHVIAGRQGAGHVRAFLWALADATWISSAVIEAARASMTAARFGAEFLGDFASGADAVFPRHLLERATADIVVPGFDGLKGIGGLLGGQDWGATVDRSALVAIGRLARPRGVFAVVCAHAWRSGAPLDGPGGVLGQVVDVAGAFEVLTPERNGLGLPLVQELERRVKVRWAGAERPPVISGVHTSAEMKTATYSALRMALEQGRLLLPSSAEGLLRELLLLRVQMLPGGGERIDAGVGHDDLADALMLAAAPYQDRRGVWRSRLRDLLDLEQLNPEETWEAGEDTVLSGGGQVVPRVPALQAVRVPRPSMSSVSYRPRIGGGAMRKGNLELRGDEYMDLRPGGVRVLPPGWTEITR